MTTTLTLTEDQLYILLSGLEAENTNCMAEDELKSHDKLRQRIIKAINSSRRWRV